MKRKDSLHSKESESLGIRLECRDVSFTYEDDEARVETLRSLSLRVGRGEFLCVLGPSGCGKTTLLRVLGGLLIPTKGTVLLDAKPVEGPSRRIGLIFQQSTLFPWFTVRGNVDFALRAGEFGRRSDGRSAEELIRLVGLERFSRVRPQSLSGGMMQRANLARAIAAEPEVLLLDEPFGSLDALSRLEMHGVLVDVWRRTRMSVVFVTHDVDEATSLGDRIAILTRRPAQVAGQIPVMLPRPRVQEGIRCKGFEEMRNNVAGVARELFLNMAAHEG